MYNMNIYKKNTVVNYIHEIDITKVFFVCIYAIDTQSNNNYATLIATFISNGQKKRELVNRLYHFYHVTIGTYAIMHSESCRMHHSIINCNY
jgi:hypothetical protein